MSQENQSSGLQQGPTPTHNRPVQSQKNDRGLKFLIEEEKELYYPSSGNKGTDQLCSYCTADLCFFSHMQNPGYLMTQLILPKKQMFDLPNSSLCLSRRSSSTIQSSKPCKNINQQITLPVENILQYNLIDTL